MDIINELIHTKKSSDLSFWALDESPSRMNCQCLYQKKLLTEENYTTLLKGTELQNQLPRER